ncbi:MAG: coagulation factor 5/8 type domain-containing protein [Myxococcota bacterium]
MWSQLRMLSVALLSYWSLSAGAPATAATIQVASTSQLQNALSSVKAGDTIQLAAGTYTGPFSITRSGTSDALINLQGPTSGSPAILTCGSTSSGYGLHVDGADYWRIKYLTVKNCKKGIVLDESNYVLLHKLVVEKIGQEAIHLRTFSSYNRVQYSTIRDIGVTDPGIGEGVYVGSSVDNWADYTDGTPDRSDYNLIQYNTFGPNVRAEAIDIKEGTTGGQVLFNTIDATGLSGENGADCFIAVKGNQYTISDNVATNTTSRLTDGIQVYEKASGWGDKNTFRRNKLTVNAPGYGIWVQSGASGNKVYTDNKVSGAQSGLTNIQTTSRLSETAATPDTESLDKDTSDLLE